MIKRSRRQTLASKIRQLIIFERRYARDLQRLRRRIAREASKQKDVAGYIGLQRNRLRDFHIAWLKRVGEVFGRDQLRYLEDRVRQASRKSAFDVFWSVFRSWIEFQAVEMSRRVGAQMIDAAKDVLQQSTINGWGTAKTARELVKAIGGTLVDNTRIARTELHTAANTASDQAAQSTGLDLVKEWGATDDKRTREDHREANGQRVEMAQAFTVGGEKLMYPGDPNGSAHQIINCRCTCYYHPRINGRVYD